MKKMRAILLAAILVITLSGLTAAAWATESFTVVTYNEVFTPVNAVDGVLTVELEAKPDTDGYIYLEKTVKDMKPVGDVTGENINGNKLEEYQMGNIICYRVKANDPYRTAKAKVQFNCSNFYNSGVKADQNGRADIPITHVFTNFFENAIERYNLKIVLPEKAEIIKVSTPSKYADFKLSEENGLKAIGISKSKLAPATAAKLDFTMNTSASTLNKIIIWAFCLAVGLFVLFARLKESKSSDKK